MGAAEPATEWRLHERARRDDRPGPDQRHSLARRGAAPPCRTLTAPAKEVPLDDSTFDRLTKTLADGLSRRCMVRLLGGGLSGTLGALLGQGAVHEALAATSCTSDEDCASFTTTCTQGVCDGNVFRRGSCFGQPVND